MPSTAGPAPDEPDRLSPVRSEHGSTLPSVSPDRLPRGSRALLVASTGGHLAQLLLVADILGLRDDSVWMTFDLPQARSLLQGKRVQYVPYVPPRGFVEAARTLPPLVPLLRRERFDVALSTGAAVAAPALLAARIRGVPSYYLESISRFDGPSLTGRVLSAVPGIHCFTQHRAWAGGRWRHDVSVVEHLTARRREAPPRSPGTGTRIFVTLGTIRPYRFDALLDNLLDALPPDASVTWQVGATSRDDLPGRTVEVTGADEFDRLAREADVVVTHAGVGSALRLVSLGVTPLLVPRRKSRGEHVDDHQVQAARELERVGLVRVREAGEVTPADLRIDPAAAAVGVPSLAT